MRRLPALLLVPALALGGCGTDASPPEPSGTPGSAATTPTTPTATAPPPTTAATPAEPSLPAFPARRPDRLAAQVALAHEWLHTRAPGSARFRRAAEFRQLATRALAQRDGGVEDDVLGRLAPPVARELRPEVRAARLLGRLTDAQPRLPTWRIVAPPPAERLLQHYRGAERAIGVPWEYLAAIHLVETRMGRIRGTSTAGAEGPMQFLPSTFAAYGEGGDINDPRDSIFAAARLLRANGAPGDLAGALWSYNHHDSYVQAVTAYAQGMERDPRTYRVYWHWRVLYKHRSGPHVLPEGYPERPAVRVR